MNRLYADGKCVGEFPEDEDYDPQAWKNTNCRNCGAPLVRGQIECEYCGTSRQIKSEIRMDSTGIRLMCY